MNIWLSGALGRMGQAVASQALEMGSSICGGIDKNAEVGVAHFPLYPSFTAAPAGVGEVIIDFSNPAGLPELLDYAVANHLPCVLATTGFTAADHARIDEAAKSIPVFQSGNMSVGVALLRHLCQTAAKVLGEGFDVEIVEAHHKAKLDAPSGTALMLYDALKDAYATERHAQYGRSGADCKREAGEIGLHSLRGGTVVGEHQVYFLGTKERICLSHSAEDRSVFAAGALKAATFLLGKAPGRYDMDDLVQDVQ